MHITQESDYAVRIVYCLAKCGTRRDARGISEEMCVTLRFSLKILGKLVSSGIVEELKAKLAEQRQELFNLRFQHTTAQLEKTSSIPAARKNIARILTVLKEKE